MKWEEYQRILISNEREVLFTDRAVPFVATLDAHFNSDQPLRFLINKEYIVEVIIGDLLFHPDDVEGVSPQSRALAQFRLAVVEEDDPDVD